MRITNAMLTNNSLTNIGKNKEAYSKYLEQYTSQKKIQRPSDDPVIAVRSLKYRSNLSELQQYVDKNIPDAFAWMDTTEYALKQVNGILTKMNTYCDQGANDTLEIDDRNSIVEALKEYKSFIYEQQANTDYAGRYVFSGYRTDTPVLFGESSSDIKYEIKEKVDIANISGFSFVTGGAKYDAANNTAANYASQAPTIEASHKFTLSYSDLDETDESDGSGTSNYVTLNYIDAAGVTQSVNATTKSINSGTVYNDVYNVGVDDVVFIPETGEMVFGDNVFKTLTTASAINVKYNKSEFTETDIRPEHYFDSVVTNNDTGTTVNYLVPEGQQIKYQINFNQAMTVNTLACDSISPQIGRTIDNIVSAAASLEDSETKLESVKKMIADTDDSNTVAVEALNKLKEQVETEISLKKKVLQEVFGSGLTGTTTAQNQVNVALSNLGARYNRLEMTFNKLQDQEVDFEEILSNNEDADIGEAYIKYNQADLLYKASLSAASKLLGNSLLDFI